jgi:hypothetical protein
VVFCCALCLLIALVIELASYLPFDPEWTLNATLALFICSFFVGAAGGYSAAAALIRLRQWPGRIPSLLKWSAMGWSALTALWFVALWTLPGVPTHCATFGQPPCGHEYVFNNHGSLTVTDRSHFLAGVRILVRVFAGLPIMFLTLILVGHALIATGKLAWEPRDRPTKIAS